MIKIQELNIQLPHAEDSSITFLAIKRGKVIGKARIENVSEPAWWISILWVEPASRSKGVGLKLLNAIEQKARENNKSCLGLTCHLKNTRAQKFYSEYGFLPFIHSHEEYGQWVKPLMSSYKQPLIAA